MCCIAGEGRACSAALGEVTVDFCLGPALERAEGGDAVWPMFVLWGDGAVYTVLCYTREQCCASVTCVGTDPDPDPALFSSVAFKMPIKK